MKDLTIDGILGNLDRMLSDMEDDCSAAEKWVTDHRTSDRSELVDELDGLKRSIKSEVSLLAMFVQRLETETTRSRIVPEQDPLLARDRTPAEESAQKYGMPRRESAS